MTTQEENYIESKLDAYREELFEKWEFDIEDTISTDLETLEEEEISRIEELNANGETKVYGAALEKHIKKFLNSKEDELFEHYKKEAEKEIDKLV